MAENNQEVSLNEYQAWEESKKIHSVPNPDNVNVRKVNGISIVDYARKNALNIVSENNEQAVINDPATNQPIVVNKKSNAWTGKDLDGNEEHGKMIRFYLKVNRIYPASREEYIDKINNLGREKDKYLTSDMYNKEYAETNRNAKEPKSLKQREKKHDETVLANSISIMDVARKKNYVILSEDDAVAKIKDPITDGEITVRKDRNTWYAKNPDGGWTNGKTIRFIARMEEVEPIVASDYILENRAQFKTSEEYNAQYKGEKVQQETSSSEQEVKTSEKNMNNAEKHYSKEQLAEIIAGTRKGIDIQSYAKLELNSKQMQQIRLGLEKGISLSSFAFPNVPAEYVKEVRLAARDGLDTSIFQLKDGACVFTAEQAREIRLGLKNGLTLDQVNIYANKNLPYDVMKELRLGIQSGFEVMKDFNTGHYKATDIHTIRMNLEVRKIIALLKEKLSMLYEFVFTAFLANVQKQTPGVATQDIKSEAALEVRDIVKNIVENMETMVSGQTEEKKHEIYIQAFSKVVESGNTLNQITQEGVTESIVKAEESFMSMVQQNELQKSSFESLMNEYVEEFSQIVEEENIKIAEFSQKLINEPNLNNEQKKVLLQGTFESEFGKLVAEKIIEHLPEPVQKVEAQTVQEETLEYMEDLEMEQ